MFKAHPSGYKPDKTRTASFLNGFKNYTIITNNIMMMIIIISKIKSNLSMPHQKCVPHTQVQSMDMSTFIQYRVVGFKCISRSNHDPN